jgi:hypothetical protein
MTTCHCQPDGTCALHLPKDPPRLTPALVAALEGLRGRTRTHPRIGTSLNEDAIVAAWEDAR